MHLRVDSAIGAGLKLLQQSKLPRRCLGVLCCARDVDACHVNALLSSLLASAQQTTKESAMTRQYFLPAKPMYWLLGGCSRKGVQIK